jgi:hypothetical protein
MAKAAKSTDGNGQALYTYWDKQISRAGKLWENLHSSGDIVVDKYRNEKAGNASDLLKAYSGGDSYNILYSSTETVKPSLYAQTPKAQASLRHKDRTNPVALAAADILESCMTYAMEEVDFDETMGNVIEDYTLPGLGQAWVRYVPTFKPALDGEGNPLFDDDKKTIPARIVDLEAFGFDYVYWKDFLTGQARTWGEVPWVAKRVYMTKDAATQAFGADIANQLSYTTLSNTDSREPGSEASSDRQAVIWKSGTSVSAKSCGIVRGTIKDC